MTLSWVYTISNYCTPFGDQTICYSWKEGAGNLQKIDLNMQEEKINQSKSSSVIISRATNFTILPEIYCNEYYLNYIFILNMNDCF